MATGPYINMKRHSAHTHAQEPHSLRAVYTKRLFIFALLSLFLYALTYLRPSSAMPSTVLVLKPMIWNATRDPSEVRIAKATILYNSHSNDILVRALELQQTQGYEVHVLRKQIVNGYADQFLWLHEIIVKELRRPSDLRAEWIV